MIAGVSLGLERGCGLLLFLYYQTARAGRCGILKPGHLRVSRSSALGSFGWPA